MEKPCYSFSRLSTFKDCEMAYFLTYILKAENKDNIYGLAGSAAHHVIEEMQQGNMTNDEAVMYFNREVEAAAFIGINFPNDSIKESYMTNVTHAIKHYRPYQGKFEIERKFDLEIEGVRLIGYIDFIVYNEDGTVSIIDFKTSSKYSKKDLPSKANQLIIYAIAMEQMGYTVRDISWQMLKYATVPGKRGTKTVERRDIDSDEFEAFYVYYPYNEFTKMDCISWITSTVKKIEDKGPFDLWESKVLNSQYSGFFCHNLCGVKGNCSKYKEFCKKYYD